jgi:glycosyltransferase involved in cell wall biosynthesis
MPNSTQTIKMSPSFIVFSDDWGQHPSSSQHLFRQLAAKHQVLWVNTIGMRRPSLSWSDVKKAYLKASRMLHHPKQYSENGASNLHLYVCQPFMLPFNSVAPIRKLNRSSVIRTVKSYIQHHNLVCPVVVSTVPNACDYVGFFNEERVVYYCVDDFAQWPGHDQALVSDMESQMVAKSDILIATSHKIYQKLMLSGKPTHLLTHGVDINLFSQGASKKHRCLEGIPRPMVGYLGLIDERSDQQLIAALSFQMEEFSFVMAGPVVADISQLNACSNIYFTGPIPYTELPDLIQGLDALFIPYVVNDFTDSISPLKLKEYLVTGKPIITTPLAEAVGYLQNVTIAKTVEEWKSALYGSLTVDVTHRRTSILEAMRSESWESKANQFLAFCTY